MKIFALLSAIVVLATHCTKPGMILQPALTTKDPAPGTPPPALVRPQAVCIDSYQSLVARLGSPTVNISAVMLEDNTKIAVGGVVDQITYTAENIPGPTSLFLSRLSVRHRYWGFEQTYNQEVWTLGCKLAHLGNGTLTNISVGNNNLVLNAGMVWSVPPHQNTGMRIGMLIK